MEALVICVADPSRPEHEAVRAAATLLGPMLPPGARLLSVTALHVDLADDMAASTSVVIVAVDAHAAGVETRRVEAAPAGEYGRPLEPGHLLDIAYANYGARPRMRLVAVPPGRDANNEVAEEVAKETLRLLGL